jgi:hypothetical protein
MTTVAGARQETDGVPLVVDGRVDAGHALLTARGELVRGCAPVLARELDALPQDTRRVELDLSGPPGFWARPSAEPGGRPAAARP